MARVVINQALADILGSAKGATEQVLTIDANNVRALIKHLEQDYPGSSQKLQSNIVVAIDGEIFSDPWLETLTDDSEVYFLPVIEGG